MDLNFSDKDEAFRQEVKDFLDKDNTQSLQEFCNIFNAYNSELKKVINEMEIALQQYKDHSLYPIFNKFVQELKEKGIGVPKDLFSNEGTEAKIPDAKRAKSKYTVKKASGS